MQMCNIQMMRVSKPMRLTKCEPAKVKTSHLDDTAMLIMVSVIAVAYQATKTLLCGLSGLKPLFSR